MHVACDLFAGQISAVRRTWQAVNETGKGKSELKPQHFSSRQKVNIETRVRLREIGKGRLENPKSWLFVDYENIVWAAASISATSYCFSIDFTISNCTNFLHLKKIADLAILIWDSGTIIDIITCSTTQGIEEINITFL